VPAIQYEAYTVTLDSNNTGFNLSAASILEPTYQGLTLTSGGGGDILGDSDGFGGSAVNVVTKTTETIPAQTFVGNTNGLGDSLFQAQGFVAHAADGTYTLFVQDGALNGVQGTFFFDTTQNGLFDLATDSANCFLAGTKVATPGGAAAVETLRQGDLVMTSDGREVAVRWMGRTSVARMFSDPLRTLPVRIKADALGDGLPTRDLLVSPDHAVLLDDNLIQAGALVNGTSVVSETRMPPFYTYYHIELAAHDLIVAEGIFAETFVDNVDRLGFDNWEEYQSLGIESSEILEMEYPRAKAARQIPTATRRWLSERANRLFPEMLAQAA